MTFNVSSSVQTNDEDYIKWEPKFKIGISVIDEQHEKLVELCNEFYKTIVREKDKDSYKEKVKETLKKCVDYTATHFNLEEKLMLAAGYEDFKNHKNTHDTFKIKIFEIYEKIDSVNYMDALNFTRFLYEWILSHIAHDDKLYLPKIIEFLKSQKK